MGSCQVASGKLLVRWTVWAQCVEDGLRIATPEKCEDIGMVSQKNGIHVFCGAFRTHWKPRNIFQCIY